LLIVTATEPTIRFQIDIKFDGMRRAIAQNGIKHLLMGAAEIDIAIAIAPPVSHGLVSRFLGRPAVDVEVMTHIPTLIVIATRSIGVVIDIEKSFGNHIRMAGAIANLYRFQVVMEVENSGASGGRI
jgi:hypothetical protein